MKYKIKITHYKSGRIGYVPYVKKGLWLGLYGDGEISILPVEQPSRADALEAIDLHYAGNYKEDTVEFEYINKD